MTEVEFIEAIDSYFSFDKDEEYEEATQIACLISDNAALMVGYELATRSSHASLELNLRLLDIMKKERPSDVVLAAIPVVRSILKDEQPSSESIQKLLFESKNSNTWNGLGIVECADELLADVCNTIRDEWVQQHKTTDNK